MSRQVLFWPPGGVFSSHIWAFFLQFMAKVSSRKREQKNRKYEKLHLAQMVSTFFIFLEKKRRFQDLALWLLLVAIWVTHLNGNVVFCYLRFDEGKGLKKLIFNNGSLRIIVFIEKPIVFQALKRFPFSSSGGDLGRRQDPQKHIFWMNCSNIS